MEEVFFCWRRSLGLFLEEVDFVGGGVFFWRKCFFVGGGDVCFWSRVALTGHRILTRFTATKLAERRILNQLEIEIRISFIFSFTV